MSQRILIAGSGSTVGQALISSLQAQGYKVFTLSRQPDTSPGHLCTDLSKESCLEAVGAFLQEIQPEVIFCCTGLLHDADRQPEKALRQMSDAWLQQNLSVNLLCHIHLARAADTLISRRHPLRWISLSAMVGSIEDNHLGGWYSYRISKAALNMFIRTLSIEWQRRSPDSVVVAQHPGTTDSPLTGPFQEGIKEGKLYTPTQTAERLIAVMSSLTAEDNGHLLHWDGSRLAF